MIGQKHCHIVDKPRYEFRRYLLSISFFDFFLSPCLPSENTKKKTRASPPGHKIFLFITISLMEGTEKKERRTGRLHLPGKIHSNYTILCCKLFKSIYIIINKGVGTTHLTEKTTGNFPRRMVKGKGPACRTPSIDRGASLRCVPITDFQQFAALHREKRESNK